MLKDSFNTPILFLIFNRPDLTRVVFDRIREVKPKYLFIGADGSREDHTEDVHKCNEAREVVLNNIDWDCQVKTLFREKNLGCGLAVSQAITWFFDHVEEGIILEDDLDPDLSFFKFSKFLLNYYHDNGRIMHISGNNFQIKSQRTDSFYFSNYPHCWGWATWRNRWEKFMLNPQVTRAELYQNIHKNVNSKVEAEYWFEVFWETFIERKIDSWAYSWHYTIWKNNGISILPFKNLVRNNGFRTDATHTKHMNHKYDKIGRQSISNSIIIPITNTVNREYDKATFRKFFQPGKSLLSNLSGYIKRWF